MAGPYTRLFKTLSFGTLTIVALTLMVATIVEKVHGTEFVTIHIYTSWWLG